MGGSTGRGQIHPPGLFGVDPKGSWGWVGVIGWILRSPIPRNHQGFLKSSDRIQWGRIHKGGADPPPRVVWGGTGGILGLGWVVEWIPGSLIPWDHQGSLKSSGGIHWWKPDSSPLEVFGVGSEGILRLGWGRVWGILGSLIPQDHQGSLKSSRRNPWRGWIQPPEVFGVHLEGS